MPKLYPRLIKSESVKVNLSNGVLVKVQPLSVSGKKYPDVQHLLISMVLTPSFQAANMVPLAMQLGRLADVHP